MAAGKKTDKKRRIDRGFSSSIESVVEPIDNTPKKASEPVVPIIKEKTIEINESAKSDIKDVAKEEVKKEVIRAEPKRGRGRPRKDPRKPCTIYLPLDMLEQLEKPLAVTNKTLSEYIENVLRENLNEKKEKYEQLFNMIQEV